MNDRLCDSVIQFSSSLVLTLSL